MTLLNFSPSCERNKAVILAQLQQRFADCRQVLEIGSGSGQHVMHFAQHLPHICWQPAELAAEFAALVHNLRDRADNIAAPKQLDLSQVPWIPETRYDGLFSANTLHIMSWQQVVEFFHRAGQQLCEGGILSVYGPFIYNSEFTAPSNADFDLWLKARDPLSGIRDFSAVDQLAQSNGFDLISDIAMPANNQLLSWRCASAA